MKSWQRNILGVDGMLVHAGLDHNTDYLRGASPLNEKGQISVNEKKETEIPKR
jgi:thioredoxin reductase